MVNVENIINEHLENVRINEDKDLIAQFVTVFGDLDESSKSNLVRILIGHGAMKKGKDGKLEVDKEKANSVRSKLGISKK